MAVYTVLTESEIGEIINQYNVGKMVKYNGISKGIMNSNYLIETENNKYILRILEGDRVIEEEKKELKYLEHLSINGIPCPSVIINKEGKDFVMVQNKMASLFSFLNGKEVLMPNEKTLNDVGKIIAKMHNLSKGLKLSRDEGIDLGYLYKCVIKNREKLKTILDKDYDAIEEKVQNAFNAKFSELPSGIIHNDIFPDNVFIDNGNISGIIDFNDAVTGPFIHDIAIVLNFWIFNNYKEYSQNLTNAFLTGYNEVRNLEEKELELLPAALDKAALTFLFLRLKKFYFDEGDAEREFKDYKDLLPLVFANKDILSKP